MRAYTPAGVDHACDPAPGPPARHNRSDILDAASEVMIFRGYEATRYSDVAEEGVPVASLQHHFPTLEVLRREALRNKVRAELTSLAEQVSLIADPWERIYHIIVTSVSLDPAPGGAAGCSGSSTGARRRTTLSWPGQLGGERALAQPDRGVRRRRR